LKQPKPDEEEPIKMLTEDGQLVQVDPKYLTGKSRHVKPGELQTWVKRKNKLTKATLK
jgi:hypothetical protein